MVLDKRGVQVCEIWLRKYKKFFFSDQLQQTVSFKVKVNDRGNYHNSTEVTLYHSVWTIGTSSTSKLVCSSSSNSNSAQTQKQFLTNMSECWSNYQNLLSFNSVEKRPNKTTNTSRDPDDLDSFWSRRNCSWSSVLHWSIETGKKLNFTLAIFFGSITVHRPSFHRPHFHRSMNSLLWFQSSTEQLGFL